MTPIVLIPGLLCSPEIFAPQVPVLWRHGAVTVASTMQGDTMAGMAAAILAGAPPRFALVGFSMGGYLSFEIMRQAPERVTALALLDTSARPDTPERTAMRRELLARRDDDGFEVMLASVLDTLMHPARQSDPGLRAINARMAAAVGTAAFVRQSAAIIGRIDSRPGLGAIAVPTLVLVGDSDVATPPEHAREMAAAIPGARLVVVPSCGHCATLEAPEAVNAALLAWMEAAADAPKRM